MSDELDLNQRETLCKQGDEAFKRGLYEEAFEHYWKARQLFTDDAEIAYKIGVTELEKAKLHRGVVKSFVFDAAIRLKPDYAEAWAGKGDVLFLEDKVTNALECYQKAEKLIVEQITANEPQISKDVTLAALRAKIKTIQELYKMRK